MMANKSQFNILANGEFGLTLSVKSNISQTLSLRLKLIAQAVRALFGKQVVEVIQGYQSLTLYFNVNDQRLDMSLCEQQFTEIATKYLNQSLDDQAKGRLIEIPVCYEHDYAPDIECLAKTCGLAVEQVIAKHCSAEYLVHFLGFMPGFMYLGGLDKSLHCPRKTTPSLKVDAGAVAIGGQQTGVYPVASPGGWHVIGRTPLSLFDASSESPTIVSPHDRVRFVPITSGQFQALAADREVLS